MCGRFVSTNQPDQIAAYFGADVAVESLCENYNVAPTQDVYGVVEGNDGVTRVEAFHWGLVPSWAKDRKIASKMINARSETLAEKNAFRGLFKKKRVLIPMDGFYEWKAGSADGPLNAKGKPLKQPLFIHRRDDEPLAVAGLWTTWKDPEAADGSEEDQWLHSTTIITTAANETMAPVHNRMPVVVPASRWPEWLDPGNDDIDDLSTLFVPTDDGSLTMHEVTTDVNNVRNNTASLIDPITPGV
jgi:putative SOS response-associated peptidase YedK